MDTKNSNPKFTGKYRRLLYTFHTGNIKNELRPHKNSYWCIPPKENAEFAACMEDISI